jgi:hypothetical protein
MRRERTIAAVVALIAAVLLAAPAASAASGTHLFTKNATDQGYGGVGGQSQKPSQKPSKNGVAGQEHTVSSKPLATAGQSGTLPFTGAQLGVFLALGLALVFGGLLLHRTGRSRPRA